MTDTREIDENILKPCMALPHDAGADVPPEARVGYLMENAVSVLPTETKSRFDELIADALSGQSVLLCDGCACACVMDTRGFEKRAVGRPEAEQVVLGPHESFGESIRTNITLLRRIVQREELMTEFLSVGGAMKTRCALLYLRGTADEAMLDLLSAMMEARASGRQDLALRSLDQAEQYLRMLGVQSVFYDAEHAALFDVLPARSGERTVRPALVRDGELVRRGVAAVAPMAAKEA